MSHGVVILGAGQAGFQTATSLRQEGFAEPITLIGDEPGLPYQRPPLSKAFMLGKQEIGNATLRPERHYEQNRITLLTGQAAVAIDRAERRILLTSGSTVPFSSLVLAVGARNRKLPIEGADLDGVCYLRTAAEAIDVRGRFGSANEIVVIGGGFIGLELAAAAATLGKSVHVLEALPRLMQRIVSPVLSQFYRNLHESRGVRISTSVAIAKIEGEQGRVRGVRLSDGTLLPADLVAIGIGVVPNHELAAAAGLTVANGIAVDTYLKTDDPEIYAIGDCAEHPNQFAGGRVRIESVQNAVDQAKCVAAAIVGRSAAYHAVPWFWTDQFDASLQMVGLSSGYDHVVTRGEPESGKFSVFYFRGGTLRAIDSVNRPGEHVAGRKLIAAGVLVSPDQAADLSVDLKALALSAPS
ncbi:MAG: FAD-dependent oxidoreductase [Bryobacteraceae bacterium]